VQLPMLPPRRTLGICISRGKRWTGDSLGELTGALGGLVATVVTGGILMVGALAFGLLVLSIFPVDRPASGGKSKPALASGPPELE
jgi:hypothetical protein